MAKMEIIGDPFKELAYKIDKIGGDLKTAANEALSETQKLVQSNTQSAAQPYAGKGRKGYATGEMFGAIKKPNGVEWLGDVASVGVGFNLREKGGFHSIFVMYGTPRIQKDTKLYNAIKGAKTKKEIAKLQEKIMQRYLSLAGGKK